MTTIREKIMAIEPQRMNIYYQDGHADAKRDAADIAEAEVARLEARVRELISEWEDKGEFLDNERDTQYNRGVGVCYKRCADVLRRVLGGE